MRFLREVRHSLKRARNMAIMGMTATHGHSAAQAVRLPTLPGK